MVTSNVIQRVFQIRYKSNLGTCFALDIDGKQYFITAKHVIKELQADDQMEIYYKKSWTNINVKLIGHSTISDVSVFALNLLIVGNPMPTSAKVFYSQDVYFLGFPYGIITDAGDLNMNFPIPLVKKGIISALFVDTPGKYYLIDGHNNPGFSGGPVVVKHINAKYFSVIGVITAYRIEYENTYLGNNETPIQVKSNTGIIIAYTIGNALSVIKNNPNGHPIRPK